MVNYSTTNNKKRGVAVRRKALIVVISACIFIVGEFILARFIHAETRRSEEANRFLVLERLSTIRARIEGLLQTNLLAIRQLRTEIYLNPYYDEERLRLIIDSIISDSLQVRHVAVGVDYVIEFIHPMTGNEAALGFDYRSSPEQLSSYIQALETSEITINGPVLLTQGGEALIARVPVFPDGEHNIVISQVIDHQLLFQLAGLYDTPELSVSIRGRNGSGAAGPLILGAEEVWQAQPVTQTIQLPSGEWVLAAIPVGTFWQDGQETKILWWVVGTLLSLLLAVLTAIILFNQQKLQLAFRTITRQARFDSLTELPNRHYFLEQLTSYLDSCQRREEQCALLFIDLDHFKEVNDSFGHEAGDRLLKVIAQRLTSSLRKEDIIDRLGGDEFVVVLKNLIEPMHAELQSEKLLTFIREPISIKGNEILIDGSIGIAIYPDDGHSALELLKSADLAMYNAKNNGRGRSSYFSESLREKTEKQLRARKEILTSIHEKHFFLDYQPIINAESGELYSVEVLVRWQHPTEGLLMPDEFIPVAEKNGTIRDLGNYVLQTTCGDLSKIRAAGIEGRLAINISSHQFYDAHALECWFAIIEDHGVSPSDFTFEITESMLMPDRERQRNMLETLHEKGIYLAIDDFGTGYSSTSYLQHFPVSLLKIDRSFVQGVPDNHRQSNLLAALIQMARALSIDVVVEGVESAQQVEFIRHHCADLIQGFYFARPMPLDAFIQRYGTASAGSKKKGGVSR